MKWQTLELPPDLRPAWLGDLPVRLPVPDNVTPSVSPGDTDLGWNFNVEATIQALRSESYAGAMSSLTDWLPFFYMNLPASLRLVAARLVFLPKKLRRHQVDPSWPVAPALDLLLHLTGRLPHPDWGDKTWAATITFDVDTVAGLQRCPHIATLVEASGFRACFYIVGAAIRREPAIVKELADRGHEIGSHDMVHDNRICFLRPLEMKSRLRQARDSIRPYGGSGFRSPSLYRSPELIAAVLTEFEYDSSLCDSDLEYNRGCASVFPFPIASGIQIPITLPMDSSLHYTGHDPDRMCALWRAKCDYIRALSGLAVLVCHAEPHLSGGAYLEPAYTDWLTWLNERDDVAILLPRELATRRWQ